MKISKKRINVNDFEIALGEKLSIFVKNRIEKTNLFYRELTLAERDEVLKKIIDFLFSKFMVFAGKHRFAQWEIGWRENLSEFQKSKKIIAIIPHYFGNYRVNRFRQRFVMALDKNFEIGMLSILEYWLFDKYFRDLPIIYEFGCGTGHNLLRLREVNNKAELWGLDWTKSSQKLINGVAKTLGDKKLKAKSFDFFQPDKEFKLDPNGAIFTVAALEQVGKKYKKFISYLIKNKISMCFHIEPIAELLDENVLVDNLSIKYFNKRNYLNGYLDYLKKLEKNGVIKIYDAKRTYIGSLFIDGYSIIIWSPIKKQHL